MPLKGRWFNFYNMDNECAKYLKLYASVIHALR